MSNAFTPVKKKKNYQESGKIKLAACRYSYRFSCKMIRIKKKTRLNFTHNCNANHKNDGTFCVWNDFKKERKFNWLFFVILYFFFFVNVIASCHPHADIIIIIIGWLVGVSSQTRQHSSCYNCYITLIFISINTFADKKIQKIIKYVTIAIHCLV